MKIGLYLPNESYRGVDLSRPDHGNPGIGGTEYNFLTLPYYFNYFYKHITFIFYANLIENMPKDFKSVSVDNLIDAAKEAKKDGCEVFIYRPTCDYKDLEFLRELNEIKIKTVAWIHNTPFKQLNAFAKNNYVKRFVNVSKEQYDMLRDHSIIYKATMIYNGFDPNLFNPDKPVKKEKKVVYLGSLIPAKGFHILARVWKEILVKVPDAKLEVIGNGKLYNRKSKLGKWGVADEKYESIFREHLSDEDGNKLDNVLFHGLLGKEKIPIMQTALVGCPNPSGVTENCPGTAIEFQACGTAVVSGAFWGLLDTVDNNNSGLLGKTDKELIENIVYLLRNEDKAIELGQYGILFVNKRFNHKKISEKWKNLFEELVSDKDAEILPIDQNPDYEFKQFSEKMRIFKEKYKFLRFFPAFIQLRPYKHGMKKIFSFFKHH